MKNKLNETHPELCKSWHPTKNTLTPEDVTCGSKIKIWWKCQEGDDHEWQSSVVTRVKWPGCPFCSGQRTSKSTSLATKMPEIAKQWHPTLNKLTPEDVTVSSARKVFWQCIENTQHIWEARIFSRTKSGAGCPFCKNKKADNSNGLATTHPELAKDWHPILNGKLTPNDVVAGSGKKVWWQCPAVQTHQWLARVKHRVNGGRNDKGTGCPYCAGQQVDENNSLAKQYPLIAQQWHPTKNGSFTPEQVVSMSRKMAWWCCPKSPDHEWETAINQRTSNHSGCPCCCGQKIVKSNCLATTHPLIAQQWHPTKNDKTPEEVTYANNTAYWWICPSNKQHIWKARIDARTRGTGCPFCASSKGEKAIKDILELEKIQYIQQYRFLDCKHKRPLPFDFAILKNNKLAGIIEFQGRQHYSPISYFGGDVGHELTKTTDKIKFDYCIVNTIPFLCIPFWNIAIIENNLRKFLEKLLII